MNAQELRDRIVTQYHALTEAVRVQRERRLWVEVPWDSFRPLLDWLVKDTECSILCTITGLDLGADLGILYHLAHQTGLVVTVSTRRTKGSPIPSVTAMFPAAELYERELVDLLGAVVEGLPTGPRYPLPDQWPADDHPLLKDWKPKGDAAQLPAAAAPAGAVASPAGAAAAPTASASAAAPSPAAATSAPKGEIPNG